MKNHSVLVGSKQHTDSYGIITHPDQLPPEAMESLYIAAVVSGFANGKSLNELVNKYNLKPEHLIVIARQLTGALTHMHKNGFAHRDVSPSNVLYDHHSKELKLIDMGSTTKMLESARSYLGTTQLLDIDGFDPGEVNEICGFSYDAKALDSWALGCVLFYCLTGKHLNYYQSCYDRFESTRDMRSISAHVTNFANIADPEKKSIIQKHLKPVLKQARIEPDFLNIVVELLREEPTERLSVTEAKKRLDNLQDNRETMSTAI